jgi:hypothetical protein
MPKNPSLERKLLIQAFFVSNVLHNLILYYNTMERNEKYNVVP